MHAFGCTVELGDKELFGQPKNCSLIANVPYPYEVNWKLVTENGSLTPICSLSKRSLLQSLTVLWSIPPYFRVPNKWPCTVIADKVCLLASIKVKKQTLLEINAQGQLFGTLE